MINKILRNNGFKLLMLLIMICLYVYRDFITFSKLYVFLDWGWDSYGSYWSWYSFLIDWVRTGFPMWTFKVGIGASIFSASNFLFDPFNLFYMFMSKETLAYMFVFVFIAKIVLSGLFFYFYLNIMGFTKKTSLIVSLLYAFNGYMILWGQHYWFANIIVYAPLMLYSLELLIQRSKWVMFCLIIGLTAVYSYYFLYMISIYLVLYATARYILLKKIDSKKIMLFICKFSSSYILGIGISAFLLFPSIYTALTNPRVGLNIDFSLKPASLVEYISILGRPFSNDIMGRNYQFVGYSNYYESPQLYCGLLTLLLIPQLLKAFKLREKIVYGSLGGVLCSFILIPYGSVIFNAFSSFTYRWSFVLIIFELTMMAYAVEFVLKDKNLVDRKILKYTFGILCKILALVFVFRLIYKSIKEKVVIDSLESVETLVYGSIKYFIVIVIFLSLYYLVTNLYSKNLLSRKIYSILIILLVCIELAAFSDTSVNKRDLVNPNYINNREGYFDNTNEIVKYLHEKDNSFYRIEKSFYSATPSEPLFQNYYGTTVYNSLNNPEYLNFLKTINASNARSRTIVDGFKDRTSIQTLLGVKYYISKNQNDKPYGYDLISKFGDFYLFRNSNYLPLGFTYNSYITEEDFSKLSTEDKDRALLKYFIMKNGDVLPETHKYLNKYNEDLKKTTSNIDIEYSKMIFGNMKIIEQQQGRAMLRYIALDSDPMITIPLEEKITNSKLKFSIEITSSQPTSGQIFYKEYSDEFKEDKSKKFSINQGTSKYEVDLGFVSADQIRIDVGEIPGEYAINNIQLTSTPVTEYINDVEKLKKESLNVDQVSDDRILGEINLSDNKLLFLSIPFDKGWHIYVDDVEHEIVSVNAGLSGVFLQKGEHNIKLKYAQPGLLQGVVVTTISLILLIFLYIRKYIQLKKTKINIEK